MTRYFGHHFKIGYSFNLQNSNHEHFWPPEKKAVYKRNFVCFEQRNLHFVQKTMANNLRFFRGQFSRNFLYLPLIVTPLIVTFVFHYL